MEALQHLTRRQFDMLQAIRAREFPDRGAPLKSLAAQLGVSPPSALAHLTPLEERGLVVRFRGKSRLTSRGRDTLLEYERHHRVVENLFGSLGLSPADTHAAALEVDLAISHETVDRICAAGGHPSTCPHGHPIPPCRDRRKGG